MEDMVKKGKDDGGTVTCVSLERLRGEATQARAKMSEKLVEEYARAMRAGAEFPPVVVFREGGDCWLADGFHRVEAARRVGREAIEAKVRPGDRRAALLHACGANTAHGLRRTNADKRRAVELMLRDEEWRDWADREIARRCAVDDKLVRRMRHELSAAEPRIAAPTTRKVSRGGTEYEIRKPAARPKPKPTSGETDDFATLWAAWERACREVRERFVARAREAEPALFEPPPPAEGEPAPIDPPARPPQQTVSARCDLSPEDVDGLGIDEMLSLNHEHFNIPGFDGMPKEAQRAAIRDRLVPAAA